MRFPEFTEEWEKKALGDIGETIIGLTYSPSDVVFLDGTIVFRSSNIQEGQIDYTDLVRVKKNIKEKIITRENDILVCARNGSARLIGKNAILKKSDAGNTFGAFMMVYRSDYNPFIHPMLSTRRYFSQVGENLGARINQITTSDFNGFEFLFPKSGEEQDKIAALFCLLDERIATQNKIIEDLKSLIKGLRANMFCSPKQKVPKLRYVLYNGDWYLFKLLDFTTRITRRNNNGTCNNVLTVAAQYGLVSQEDFFNKTVASNNLTGYYLLHKGEYAYNKSYSGEYSWGAIKRLDNFEKGVLSTLYICFSVDSKVCDSDFLTHYFESTKWHEEVKNIAGEGARNHGLLNIAVGDFFDTKHRVPSLQEQRQIANTLNTVAHKLDNEQQLLRSLERQRKYLLRSMFI